MENVLVWRLDQKFGYHGSDTVGKVILFFSVFFVFTHVFLVTVVALSIERLF